MAIEIPKDDFLDSLTKTTTEHGNKMYELGVREGKRQVVDIVFKAIMENKEKLEIMKLLNESYEVSQSV